MSVGNGECSEGTGDVPGVRGVFGGNGRCPWCSGSVRRERAMAERIRQRSDGARALSCERLRLETSDGRKSPAKGVRGAAGGAFGTGRRASAVHRVRGLQPRPDPLFPNRNRVWMAPMKYPWNLFIKVLALVALAFLTDCSSNSPGGCVGAGCTTATGVCTPGATNVCTCSNGTSGAATCNAAGTAYGACVCNSTNPVCTPGATQVCACANGTSGAQTCLAGGAAYGACVCSTPTACTPGATVACTCTGTNTPGTQTCNAAGTAYNPCGPCSATSTCSVAAGAACQFDSQCCPDTNGVPTYCTQDNGAALCHSACAVSSDCLSNCCVARTDGIHVCANTSYCTCTAAVGTACTADAQCCPESTGNPTYCTGMNGVSQCQAACTLNSNCVSGCCAARADGVHVCADPSYCAACSVAVGNTCSSDAQCCADPTSGRTTYCTNEVGTTVCRTTCTVGTDCASGCCARRSDGVFICSDPSLCP